MGEIKSVFVFVGADEMNLRGVERGRVSTGLPLRLLRGRETPLRCRRSSANLLLWRRSGVVGGGGGRGRGGRGAAGAEKDKTKTVEPFIERFLGALRPLCTERNCVFYVKITAPPLPKKKESRGAGLQQGSKEEV